jgi:hypothetical protein
MRESLCALGTGYFATRGAAPESTADGGHYPGTYVAGLYNRLTSDIAGRDVENEDIVNVPNWLPLTFRVEGGAWFSPDAATLVSYRQELDMRRGVLTRLLRLRDEVLQPRSDAGSVAARRRVGHPDRRSRPRHGHHPARRLVGDPADRRPRARRLSRPVPLTRLR